MFIKKIFLFSIIFFSFLTTHAVIIPTTSEPVKKETTKPGFTKIKVAAVEKMLQRKLKFKEKVAIFLYNHKIIKVPFNEGDEKEGLALGKKALVYALGGWLLVLLGILLPFIGILAIVAFVFSTVLGIKALKKNKGDTNATVALVLSGLYILLFIVGLILLFSWINL